MTERSRAKQSDGGEPEPPSDAPDRADIVALPPLIFLIGLLLGYALEELRPTALGANAWRYPAGGFLIFVGIALALWSEAAMRRHHTSPFPWKPTTAIADDGPYGYTRNPLYVAQALMSLGIGILLDSWWCVVLLVPVLLVVRYGVIGPEEVYLERKFGATYRDYTSRVRRWL